MLHILRNIITAFNTCAALVDKHNSTAIRKTSALVAENKANNYNRVVNEKERVSMHSSQWGHWLQSCWIHDVTKIHHRGIFTFKSLVHNIICCFNFAKIPQARISKIICSINIQELVGVLKIGYLLYNLDIHI